LKHTPNLILFSKMGDHEFGVFYRLLGFEVDYIHTAE
jgi:hypothetical protein